MEKAAYSSEFTRRSLSKDKVMERTVQIQLFRQWVNGIARVTANLSAPFLSFCAYQKFHFH
jgi:hypothetical protein